MPKGYVSRNSFNAGEISELVSGFREDISKYSSSCRILENAVPLVEGGAKKMPGTHFAGATAVGGATFIGSITGTTLTVTSVSQGVLRSGQEILGAGVVAGTILSSGAYGGAGGGTTVSIPGGEASVDSSTVNASTVLSGFPSAVVLPGSVNVTVPISVEGVFQNIRGHIKAIYSYSIDSGVTWIQFYSVLDQESLDTSASFSPVGIANLDTLQIQISVQATAVGNPPNSITASTGSITVYAQGGTVTLPYTGTGGVGTYLVSISQTVPSETMHTASTGTGISRLVTFQFSTEQGAFLELSSGIIRIWEGATQGDWSLGLALDVPSGAVNYDPATLYAPDDLVLLGPCVRAYTGSPAQPGAFFIAAPYGTSNVDGISMGLAVNTADALSVTVFGSSPNQGIQIKLANATPTKNSGPALQAAIRALGFLNSPVDNFIDLTGFTVTPDSVYQSAPWIGADATASADLRNSVRKCVLANQFDQFPLEFSGVLLVDNSTYWVQQSGFSGNPIELVTPYAESDLFDLDCSTQSADVLWIFHHKYPTAVVERLSGNSWQYSLSLPGQQPGEPPYRGTPDVVKTGFSALGQSITAITQSSPCTVTVSATSVVFPAGSRVYLNLIAGMVELNQGEFLVANPSLGAGTFSFTLKDPNTGFDVNSTGYLKYVSGGFAVKVIPMFAAPGDYPACGTLYQERLCVGGTDNNPTQMNGSVQDDYSNFIADPNAEDYAIQFTLVSNKLDQILNMIGTPNALMIGSAGGVWIMTGTNGSSLSQTNVFAAKQTNIGVSNLQPQLVNDSAIFFSRSTRIVMFLVFNFSSNQWDNYDLTRLNRSITLGPSEAESGITQTALQMEPYPILWSTRRDGQLIGLVFNKQDQVFAWFRINMPDARIESVAVISGKNIEDMVGLVVNRTINGSQVRYVEYFMQQELFGQLSNAFFVNCGQQWDGGKPTPIIGVSISDPCVVTAPGHGLSDGMFVRITDVVGMTSGQGANKVSYINQGFDEAYTVSGATANTFQLDGVNSIGWAFVFDPPFIGVNPDGFYVSGGFAAHVTNEVTGMSYLMGEEVTAVGDGALILTPTVVTSDAITFPYYANLITIGLPYQVTIQPVNPVLTSTGATTRGLPQKLSRITLSLYQSMGGQYGTDSDHMYDIVYGPGAQSQQPAMSTEEFSRDMDADWDDSAELFITQNTPFPFTLRGVVMSLNYNQD